LAAILPASASAGGITLGPPVPTTPQTEGFTCSGPFGCSEFSDITWVQRTVPDAGVTLVAPADGLVTSWRVSGKGTVKLRVLHTVGGALTGGGTSAPAADLSGGANATNMPIRAGDRIAVDLTSEPQKSTVFAIFGGAETSATLSSFEPAIPNDESQHTGIARTEAELLVNATIAFPPAVAGLTPTSGAAAGGETVKIFGSNLDGATSVKFGSAPAIFAVDSPGQITATAPAVTAGSVDLTVTGPGGTSPVNASDKYTFMGASAAPGTTGPSLISPLTAGQPKLTALAQSASTWRRGHQQAKISRAPVGTTFSFNLSKPATVKLGFTQKASGRKVRGACKPKTPSNASKRKCTRTILAGSLSLPGHAGLNKLRFQGLLPNGKSLKLGSYNVALSARDSGGLQSAAHSLSFSIVG
jgi:hypothetical protein